MGYKLNRSIKLSDIASELKLPWRGIDIVVESVNTLENADASDLTFCKQVSSRLRGVAIVCPEISVEESLEGNGIIVSSNPRLDFIRALSFLERDVGFSTWTHSSDIHQTAVIGQNVVIESGCVVGENSIIEHNVVLHAGTRVGENSRIRSCSSIGGDGFGFERLEDKTPLRFPHLGGVVIGNNVEIGALNSVARGALGDTIIKENTKTDNLVHIAHNCVVGERVLITACAELSGGVVLGADTWIGPNSSIIQKINVGEGALVGLGAVVTKDVPEMCVFAGNPAKKIRELK